MIILLSPTKQMDFTGITAEPAEMKAAPFEEEAVMLNDLLQKYNREELASLMGISPALADHTYRNIQDFINGASPGKPAIFAYSGTVFKALNPGSFTGPQLQFAQKHLRILSGLYGILTPFSEISPYRLEMKTSLDLLDNISLTSLWRPRVGEYLKAEPTILNLASGEYSAVIDKRRFKGGLITFYFKELKGNKLKTVRGLMLRRILMDMIVDLRILQQGETGGYRYNKNLSSDTDWVFTR